MVCSLFWDLIYLSNTDACSVTCAPAAFNVITSQSVHIHSEKPLIEAAQVLPFGRHNAPGRPLKAPKLHILHSSYWNCGWYSTEGYRVSSTCVVDLNASNLGAIFVPVFADCGLTEQPVSLLSVKHIIRYTSEADMPTTRQLPKSCRTVNR